jgi:antitoxin component of MazEF toxin-antitoxin module
MMHTRRTLRKVGGSVMLPIPSEMLEEMRLRAGQDVMLSSEGDVIRVEQYGGSEGVRDEESLLGAIERLWQASFGQEHFVSTFEKAAFLMESTIRRHPFVDGNKRTGAASVSYLLSKTLSENHFMDLEQRRISPRMDLPMSPFSTVLKGDAPYERGYHNEGGGLL